MTGEESHEYVLRQYRQAISLIWFRLSRFIRAKADKPEDLEFTDKLLNVMQSIFECEGASYDCDLRKKQLEFWSTHKHKEWDVENYTRFTITDVPLDILRDMLSIKQTVWPFVR